jgi:uncharacterized protein YbjQ (UPF0145 family)
MILTTTGIIQDKTIDTYLGVVTAEVVYGSNAIRDFFAKVRNVIGGRTGSYERLFEQGQHKALEELEKRARQLGANAVIGIHISTNTINLETTGVLLLITATGTAVKVETN